MNFEPVQVACHSGYRVNEYPVAFTVRGRRFEIREIIDRWYEGGLDPTRPEIGYFKVKTAEGRVYLLRYLSLFDSWSIRDPLQENPRSSPPLAGGD